MKYLSELCTAKHIPEVSSALLDLIDAIYSRAIIIVRNPVRGAIANDVLLCNTVKVSHHQLIGVVSSGITVVHVPAGGLSAAMRSYLKLELKAAQTRQRIVKEDVSAVTRLPVSSQTRYWSVPLSTIRKHADAMGDALPEKYAAMLDALAEYTSTITGATPSFRGFDRINLPRSVPSRDSGR